MYPCHYPGCTEEFTNHTFLMNHILRDHSTSRRRVNWNEGILAIIAAIIIALALLRPVAAQDAPPSVGEPPTIAVEHKVFLPVIMVQDDVGGQGRYWGGLSAKPDVSWCPSCSK